VVLCTALLVVSLSTSLIRAEAACGICQVIITDWTLHGDASTGLGATHLIVNITTSPVYALQRVSMMFFGKSFRALVRTAHGYRIAT